jgi:mono/diheme cytochrome c family protein
MVCLFARQAGARCDVHKSGKGRRQRASRAWQILVKLGGCNDCHTPGYFLGKPDTARFLGGSDVGFEVPGLGTFVGRNLTPDKDTGLGNWTKEEIITAFQTGVRSDGRVLGPPMPWRSYAGLTQSDANAIAEYLRSLPPVQQAIPGPFGPGEKVRVLRLTILPPDDISQPK